MKTSDLLKKIALKTGFSEEQVKKVYTTLLETVEEEIKEQKKVILNGFGSFTGKFFPARTRKNPKTQEDVKVEAKVKPNFTFSETFKNKINEK